MLFYVVNSLFKPHRNRVIFEYNYNSNKTTVINSADAVSCYVSLILTK